MTTRNKLAFALELGRRTRASVRQCEALLRLAATYRGLHSLSTSSISPGQDLIDQRKLRMAGKIMAVCNEIGPIHDKPRNFGRCPHCKHYGVDCTGAGESMTAPRFDGAALKIRVPDGGEVVVPA